MSARFVRLRAAGRKADVDIRVSAIEAIVTDDNDSGCRVETARGSYDVRESPAEILALLAEPAPAPSVEVTMDAVYAAIDAARSADGPWPEVLRAAIIAADRARGLRP